LYFHFIFDWHLKRSFEILGTRIYGAEVNVGTIKTSFFNGSFLLSDLEVTNKENPKLNSIKIHSIKFGFLWDALLRLKFVINEAGVDGIEVNSPRNKIGFVKLVLPETNSAKENDSSKNSNGGIGASLSGVTSIVKGIDEKSITESLRGNLKSEAHIKKLQADLKDKEKLWKERIDKLPQKGEFEALAARAKKLKFDTHDLKQFAADVKEADSIKKEADTKIKTMKETTDGIKADVSKFKSDFNQIDDLVKEDIASVKTQLKLPALDAKSLSKSIFGKLIDSKMGAYKKYWLLAQKYLPPNLLSPKKKGGSEDNAYVPTKRGAGKNYRFPVTVGYPLFWLKRATISSEPTSQGLAGKVAGELTNVTSDPAYIKKPAILDVRGEFARSNIFDTHLKIVADHIASAKDSLEFTVGAFPLQEQTLIAGSDLSLGFKKAQGSSHVLGNLFENSNDQIEFVVDFKNEFKNIDYDLKAQNDKMNEILKTILAGIPSVTLNAAVKGNWQDMNTDLNSNLGDEISKGFSKYIKAQMDLIDQKIKAQVTDRIKGEKEKLTQEYDKLKGKVDGQLQSKNKEVDAAKKDVSAQSKNQKKSSTDALKDKAKDFLKGIKF
jgi:uncharacterized protein (TIGR03545 family)